MFINSKQFSYYYAFAVALCCGAAAAQEEMPKDILPAQAQIYAVSPGGTAAPSSVASNGLKVSIWVDQGDVSYNIGESVTIYAKTNRDAYLTIVDVGTSGAVTQIFPNQYQQNNFVRQGQVVQIPGRNANYQFRIHGPVGTELVKAIATNQPINIYGKSANTFQPAAPFSKSTQSAEVLSKDILVELNSHQANQWAHYNKVIYIRDGSGYAGGSYNNNNNIYVQTPYHSAAAAEQALHLTSTQIRAIQSTLQSKGYYNGRIDGIIGSGTRRAIRNWQQNAGLNATGYIDSATFAQLI